MMISLKPALINILDKILPVDLIGIPEQIYKDWCEYEDDDDYDILGLKDDGDDAINNEE